MDAPMKVSLLLLVLAPTVVGCATAAPTSDAVDPAAGTPHVLAQSDVEFPWNAAYNQVDDHLAAVLPLDLMIYDGESGEPVPGVEVELSSTSATFVEADAVLSGTVDCDACLWDAYRDEYIDLPPEAGVEPLVVTSDAAGLVRAYAVVDTLPISRGPSGVRFEAATVRVRIEGEEQALRLEPR
jgi:hypothetical protein